MNDTMTELLIDLKVKERTGQELTSIEKRVMVYLTERCEHEREMARRRAQHYRERIRFGNAMVYGR